MNEQASWIFYRYAIGGGTILLGIAAIIVAYKICQIEVHLKNIDKQIAEDTIKYLHP